MLFRARFVMHRFKPRSGVRIKFSPRRRNVDIGRAAVVCDNDDLYSDDYCLEVRGVTRPPWTRGDERQQHPEKVATGRGRHRQRDGGGTALFDRHFKARNSTGTRQGRLRQLPTGTQ